MALPRALYRALLRPVAAIRRSSQPAVVLWPPVHPSAWGQFEYGSAVSNEGGGMRLLPMPDDLSVALWKAAVLFPPSPVVDGGDLFR
jgi:hypothetical protein